MTGHNISLCFSLYIADPQAVINDIRQDRRVIDVESHYGHTIREHDQITCVEGRREELKVGECPYGEVMRHLAGP